MKLGVRALIRRCLIYSANQGRNSTTSLTHTVITSHVGQRVLHVREMAGFTPKASNMRGGSARPPILTSPSPLHHLVVGVATSMLDFLIRKLANHALADIAVSAVNTAWKAAA